MFKILWFCFALRELFWSPIWPQRLVMLWTCFSFWNDRELGHRWQPNALVSSGQISHWAAGTLQPLEIRKLQPQLKLQLRKSTFCFLWLFTTKRGKWFYPPPIYPSHISKHAAPPVSVPYFVKQMSIMSEVTICLVKNWVTSALHHSFLQYLNELTLTDIDSHSIADAE